MEEKLRANPIFCKSIHLPNISGSQLSLRTNDLPMEYTQELFQMGKATLKIGKDMEYQTNKECGTKCSLS